jgi:xylan 1,4-beta-xylosidase
MDSRSWACKNDDGSVQLLFWDFTNTHPGDSVNNQEYYIRDLPSKLKGKVKVEISNIPAGQYRLEIYKVGYHVNETYSTYLDMGKLISLAEKQLNKLKS